MSWNGRYSANQRPWGTRPSELAFLTASYLREHPLAATHPRMIDMGCGYGRDSYFLNKTLEMPVLGIDRSEVAIRTAIEFRPPGSEGVSFRCCDLKEIEADSFDVCFASNLYHVLEPDDRRTFQTVVREALRPKGLLFLNCLSTNDREEYGKGAPVLGEADSFVGDKYLHFFTRQELLDDFRFLDVMSLDEHRYDEPHEKGPTHHYTSWIMIGLNKLVP